MGGEVPTCSFIVYLSNILLKYASPSKSGKDD